MNATKAKDPISENQTMKNTNRAHLNSGISYTQNQGETSGKLEAFGLFPAKKLSAKHPKKYHHSRNGWINVNVHRITLARMRKLAAAKSITFRLFCESALRSALFQAMEEFGLTYQQIDSLTPKQINSLAERSRLVRRLASVFYMETN